MYLNEILAYKRAVWRDGIEDSTGVPAERERPARLGTLASVLRRSTVAVIAEVKPKSPSKGPLWPAAEGPSLARDYTRFGASAISVLAEDRFFGGSPGLVSRITGDDGVTVPVLYKDFVVDVQQVEQAWATGADGVLVIVRALDAAELRDIMHAAANLQLDTLVEAFTEEDVERALEVGARIVGINNRDLQTFAVNLDNSARLRRLLPDDVISVSESGIADAIDVRRVADSGFDAILVGETLLCSGALETTLGELAGVPAHGGAS